MFAKGFAIQKVLKDGKLIDEQGIMGEFDNKQGARIVEVSDGQAKYTELTPSDIMKLISRPASSESLEHRIAKLVTRKHHHHRLHRHHHSRGVASGHHTKRHRRKHRHKKRHTHKHKHRRKYHRRHTKKRRK